MRLVVFGAAWSLQALARPTFGALLGLILRGKWAKKWPRDLLGLISSRRPGAAYRRVHLSGGGPSCLRDALALRINTQAARARAQTPS